MDVEDRLRRMPKKSCWRGWEGLDTMWSNLEVRQWVRLAEASDCREDGEVRKRRIVRDLVAVFTDLRCGAM
jgi:hypothetical protein